MTADLYYLLIWAIFIFILGFSFLPFTFLFFEKFFDKGYIFAKIIGLSIFSYIVFLLGSLKIVSFSQTNLVIIFVVSSLIFFLIPQIKKIGTKIILRRDFSETLRKNWKIFLLEEIIFSLCLLTWATIRSFNPDIAGRGLAARAENIIVFGFFQHRFRIISLNLLLNISPHGAGRHHVKRNKF